MVDRGDGLKGCIKLVDEYLGSLIEELIDRYYSDQIDKEFAYDDVLFYITVKLLEDKNSRSKRVFARKLRKLARDKSIGKLLLSYLISKYIEERGEQLELLDEADDYLEEY